MRDCNSFQGHLEMIEYSRTLFTRSTDTGSSQRSTGIKDLQGDEDAIPVYRRGIACHNA